MLLLSFSSLRFTLGGIADALRLITPVIVFGLKILSKRLGLTTGPCGGWILGIPCAVISGLTGSLRMRSGGICILAGPRGVGMRFSCPKIVSPKSFICVSVGVGRGVAIAVGLGVAGPAVGLGCPACGFGVSGFGSGFEGPVFSSSALVLMWRIAPRGAAPGMRCAACVSCCRCACALARSAF